MNTVVSLRDASVLSLLQALESAQAHSVVLHVGEAPYIVTESEAVSFGAHPVDLAAAIATLEELLPPDRLRDLSARGASECRVAVRESGGRVYDVVAARGGDDVWIEIVRTAAVERLEPEPGVIVRAAPGAHPVVVGRDRAERDWEPIALEALETQTSVHASGRIRSGDDLVAQADAIGAEAVYGGEGRLLLARTAAGLRPFGPCAPLPSEEFDALLESLTRFQAGGGSDRFRLHTFNDQAGRGFTLVRHRDHTFRLFGVLPGNIADVCGRRRGLLLVAGSAARRHGALWDVATRAAEGRGIVLVFADTNEWGALEGQFVSVRTGLDPQSLAAALQDAARQQVDLVVLETLADPAVAAAVSASEEMLVIAGVPEPTSRGALERVTRSLVAADAAESLRDALADSLIGVVARSALRGSAGERVMAYELIENGPRLAMVISDHPPEQLWRTALREKRTETLESALLAAVADGRISTRDAFRRAPDRTAFLRSLRVARRKARSQGTRR